jgi:hypothetical protein
MCVLQETLTRIGNTWNKGKHASRRAPPDRIIRIVSRPSRERDSFMYNQEFPKRNQPHDRGTQCLVIGPGLTLFSSQWSRTQFDNLFVKPAQAINAYLSEPNYLESTLKYSGQQREQVEQIVSYLVTNKPLTFEECIVWARLQFERDYNNDIRQLLFSLPKDAVTSSGQPFWSGPKRAPDPLTFNSSDVRILTSSPTTLILFVACSPWVHHRSSESTCI